MRRTRRCVVPSPTEHRHCCKTTARPEPSRRAVFIHASPANLFAEQRQHRKNQKHDEKNPRNVAGRTGNAGKAQRGDDGDDEKSSLRLHARVQPIQTKKAATAAFFVERHIAHQFGSASPPEASFCFGAAARAGLGAAPAACPVCTFACAFAGTALARSSSRPGRKLAPPRLAAPSSIVP